MKEKNGNQILKEGSIRQIIVMHDEFETKNTFGIIS